MKNTAPTKICQALLCGFSILVLSTFDPASNQEPITTIPLDQILEHTAEYCELVKQMALKYVCMEEIEDKENELQRVSRGAGLLREERSFQTRSVKRSTWKYDFQLIKKGEELSEQRILLEKNGKIQNKKNAEINDLKYQSRYLIFGPVGFLSKYWQQHFDYEITGIEDVGKQPAVILMATPKNEREDNYNIGRIWISPKYQILRVEWEPASIQNYIDETFDSSLGEFKKTVVWTVDYGVEKNNVRFPSRQLIRELYLSESDRGYTYKTIKKETQINYLNYKFFVVETDIKYK